MKLNRREFVLKAAAISGAAALQPFYLFAQTEPSSVTTAGASDLLRPLILPDARKAESKLGLDPRIWNWRKGASGAMPANYYEDSLAEWPRFSALPGERTCDVVVIGGGLLGASAALHLTEAGLDVILVEKNNIGSGASGRNGGQLTPGLARWEADTILENLPSDEARRLWRFSSIEAMELIDELAERYGFECDRKRGHLTAAIHSGHIGALVKNADARRALGDRNVSIIGPHELQEYVRSDIYHGGTLDSIGGQVHPLALLRGMVYGFVQQGGRVYEDTEVIGIQETAEGTVVTTASGVIRARKAAVLAVHYATHKFISGSSTTMPFVTYVGVTEPLKTDVRELLPADLPIYDTQLQIDYYRAVRGNRLLFGGQGTGNSWSPRDVNNYLLERIETVFSQLEKPKLEYSWGGITDLTINGATDSRKSESKAPVYMVHGWSGHGVAQTVRIGKAISDDVTGRNNDFDMLTRINHAELPLGKYISPVVIPLIKGALTVKSTFNPADMVSF